MGYKPTYNWGGTTLYTNQPEEGQCKTNIMVYVAHTIPPVYHQQSGLTYNHMLHHELQPQDPR